ncbi:hypothetical protein SLEP1_g22778 [Rubroshorea leprosula]|uniref:Uncharacterized protein n=1 Tax=Rubroshorea leprosula TaxID=152421 RepID=A0AAV5JA93_9ROSI|nr:hypothetical protein SLEP1_g22778 [Rubroshorea leprosula]
MGSGQEEVKDLMKVMGCNGGFSVKGAGHGDGCKRRAVVLGYGNGPCSVKRADDEG